MATMKTMTRRDLFVAIPVLAATGANATLALAVQGHASEFPAPQSKQSEGRSADEKTASAVAGAAVGTLGAARAIGFDQMAVRTMANGGESRAIAHGTLATGETVNVHQSMQAVGSAPNPAHVIQHSEFILVREGEVEFQHEVAGQMVSEKVGPGGVIYIAFGTRHAVKNAGDVPARYFVVAVGGDAK
jgi:mannose-6-phosphate isomerase-like protein (cupin superfamily)